MTTRQNKLLLNLIIDNSYISPTDTIWSCITLDNKNYAQVAAMIIAFEKDKKPCTNYLLKTIIEHGWINCNGTIWSCIQEDNKNYEKIKAMILECENDE